MSGNDERLPGRLARAAALALLLAACGRDVPPPDVTSPISLPSDAPSATPVATPGASEGPTPASPATLIEHGVLADSHNALALTSDGETIVFSGAPARVRDPSHGPNLYRARPGEPPMLVYAGPRPDSDLLPVAVGGGYVAFAETNVPEFGDQGWILWLLPPGAAAPVELDRNPADLRAPFPLVTVNERHVVWQHVTFGEVPRAELIQVALPDMTRRILRADDASRYQWWDPALDGDLLVYTEVDYVHGAPDALDKPAELYAMLVDLAVDPIVPRRLDDSGMATEPAIHAGTVTWKEAQDVAAWGTLSVHDLATGATERVLTTPQSGVKTPSVGNRFIAFWGIDATKFYLYDLKVRRVVPVYEVAETVIEGAAYRPEVTGDLLVWAMATESGGFLVAWGRLPTMDDP